MIVPEGYTEADVLYIIDGIVNYLAPVFSFGYYDVDDIKQEGRIFALECLPKYQPGKELKNFLFTHIRNRLINLKRNKLCRPDPCNSCHKCTFIDRMECSTYLSWYNRSVAKRNLIEPYNDDVDVAVESRKLFDNYCQSELISIIDENLPLDCRGDFLKILEGCTISKFRKEKLISEINIIIQKYYKDGYK